MRVSISGEKSLINSLQDQIEKDKEIKIERLEEAKDKTELAFGIGDVLTLISIVNGVADLVKLLMKISVKRTEKQKLYLKTALGTTKLEISKDITPEQLRQQLGMVFQQ